MSGHGACCGASCLFGKLRPQGARAVHWALARGAGAAQCRWHRFRSALWAHAKASSQAQWLGHCWCRTARHMVWTSALSQPETGERAVGGTLACSMADGWHAWRRGGSLVSAPCDVIDGRHDRPGRRENFFLAVMIHLFLRFIAAVVWWINGFHYNNAVGHIWHLKVGGLIKSRLF